MPVTLPAKLGLDVEDFRRLGVRPHECRLTVIRRAAARSAKALAEQQLTSPTDQVGLQLSRVATSAYRLLDPRQRTDVHQRAYVGRILPGAQSWASQDSFLSDAKQAAPETPFSSGSVNSESASDAELIDMLDLNPCDSGRSARIASLNDDDLLDTSLTGRITRPRRRLRHPWIMLVLAGLAIGTLLGLATLRWRYDPAASTSMQPESVTATAQKPDYAIPERDATKSISNQPGLTSSLDIADGSYETSSLSDVGLAEVGAVKVEVETIAPLESSFGIPDPVSEQPLEEPGSGSSVAGVFLPDPFAFWRFDDSPPTEQDVELPVIDAGAKLVEPSTVIAPMTAPESISRGDLSEPEVPRRSVPDSGGVRAARARLVSFVPELAESVIPQTIEDRIAKIEALEQDLTIGTLDSWTARLMVGELAWLVEDAPQVGRRLKSLTKTYQVQLHQLLADTFVAACDLASFPETRQQLLNNGLALADQLLLEESFQDCQRVVDAANESAEFLESHSELGYLKQLSKAADQMSRSSETSRRMINDAGESDRKDADAGIAGRYYCLMLRRWDIGLPWLVSTSDARIARVARQELALDEAAPAADLIKISHRWLKVASRSSGRASDSMRMHAIDLMRKARSEASAIKEREIDITLNEVLEVLPPYLRDAASTVESTPAPTKIQALKPAVSRSKNGLSGRIEIERKRSPL